MIKLALHTPGLPRTGSVVFRSHGKYSGRRTSTSSRLLLLARPLQRVDAAVEQYKVTFRMSRLYDSVQNVRC